MKVYIVVQYFSIIGMTIDKVFASKEDAQNYINSFKMYTERDCRCIKEWKVEKGA